MNDKDNNDVKNLVLSNPAIAVIVMTFIAVSSVVGLMVHFYGIHIDALKMAGVAQIAEKNSEIEAKNKQIEAEKAVLERIKAEDEIKAAILIKEKISLEYRIDYLNGTISALTDQLKNKTKNSSGIDLSTTKQLIENNTISNLKEELDTYKDKNSALNNKITDLKSKITPKRTEDYKAVFEFGTKNEMFAVPTDGFITVLFTDKKIKAFPYMDEAVKIIAEFNFPGSRFTKGKPAQFERKLKHIDFLDSNYIQIINFSDNCWKPSYFKLSVDGVTQINKQVIPNEKQQDANDNCIQNFNEATWNKCSYWSSGL